MRNGYGTGGITPRPGKAQSLDTLGLGVRRLALLGASPLTRSRRVVCSPVWASPCPSVKWESALGAIQCSYLGLAAAGAWATFQQKAALRLRGGGGGLAEPGSSRGGRGPDVRGGASRLFREGRELEREWKWVRGAWKILHIPLGKGTFRAGPTERRLGLRRMDQDGGGGEGLRQGDLEEASQ